MLYITVSKPELWDDDKQEFIKGQERTLQLEHSLVSISKWESKWHKAFLSKREKSDEEALDYIRDMTITQNVPPDLYSYLSQDNMDMIYKYIEEPMSATVFPNGPDGPVNKDTITTELIYYWMIALSIPFNCEKWHLNRLLKLIEMCNRKNAPPKKRSVNDILSNNASVNAARKKQFHTSG